MTQVDGMPEPTEEYTDEPVITPEAAELWNKYLNTWERDVYGPLFAKRGISRDAALTCWFVNRLRNALPDDDAGNEPWRD